MEQVIVKLGGRLGNQLFQYALAVVQASRRRCEYRFDASGVVDTELAPLRQWVLSLPIATPEEQGRLKGDSGLRGKLFRARQRLIPVSHRKWILQTRSTFDLSVFRSGTGAYFDGYWQGWGGLEGYENLLRRALSYHGQLAEVAASVKSDVSVPGSVSVHVRRGDFLLQSDFTMLGTDYFTRAIQEIGRTNALDKVFVFSDDIHWCQENLHFPLPTQYVIGNSADVDLFLMSQCEHHVIANSTFSWWAAWLGRNPAGRVVAPRLWFPSLGSTPPLSFIYPPQWTLIDP